MAQLASDDRVTAEAVASLDLFLDVPVGQWRLHAYVEAGTSRFASGISRLVPEANTDAGTALDGDGDGRVQLSELRLVWPVAADFEAHAGLLDATGFLDVSRIANDENLHFLAVPFVNNPSIPFPDYALGMAVEANLAGDRLEVDGVLTSSHGLADSPARSYGQLVDVTAPGKGVFAGATLRWSGPGRRASVGAWTSTATYPLLDGSGSRDGNRGLFAVLGTERGRHSLSARLGATDGAVSPGSGFAGLTYLWAAPPDAAGLGVGRTFASGSAAGAVASDHLELFVRRGLVGRVFVTWSLQRLWNPGLDATGAAVGPSLWIGGVRLSAQL